MKYIGLNGKTINISISKDDIINNNIKLIDLKMEQELLAEQGEKNASSIPVGSILRVQHNDNLVGFRLCDGSNLRPEKYPELFERIGYNFSPDGNNEPFKIINEGHGKPWQQQYYIERPDPGNLQWEETTPLPEPVGWGMSFITKNRVYVCGGSRSRYDNKDSIVNRVHTAPINEDGTIGTWVTAPSLPGVLHISQAVVTKNRVYLLGGYTESTPVSTIYTAPINEDGTIGDWVTASSLLEVSCYSQAVVTKNRVYLLGGLNESAYVSTVYTAPINEDGTIGTWVTAPSLPGVLAMSQAVVTKNRVYLLGGFNGSAYVSTVYTAPINGDGTIGAWTTAPSLPRVLAISQAVVTKNRVYLLGGYVSAIYTAPINEDGIIGDWETTQNFPIIRNGLESVVTTSKFVYVLGGRESAYWKDTARVFRAPLDGGFNSYFGKTYDATNLEDKPDFYLPKLQTSNIHNDLNIKVVIKIR